MAIDTAKFLNITPTKLSDPGFSFVDNSGETEEDSSNVKLLSIKTKIITANDILKGTLAVEKKALDDQRKRDEKVDRDEEEKDIETPDTKDTKNAKKLGIKMPKMGFLDGVKNFIFTTLFGWAAVNLLELLPKLTKLLAPLASIVSFIMKVGEVILKALVAFVDAGYKAYDWTKKQIGEKLGEGAAQKFAQFSGLMNKMMNTIFILGMTTAAFADALGGINPMELLENLGKKKWVRKTLQRGRILAKRGRRKLARAGARIGNEAWLRRRQLQRKGTQVLEGVKQSKLGQKIKQRAIKIREGVGKKATTIKEGVGRRLTSMREGVGGFASRTRKSISEGFQARKKQVIEGVTGSWNKLKGVGKKFKNSAAASWEKMSTAVRKEWTRRAEAAAARAAKNKGWWSRLKGKIDEGIEWAGKGLEGLGEKAKTQLMEKLVTPFSNFLRPIGKWAQSVYKPIWSAVTSSPAFKWIQEALATKGIANLGKAGLGEIAQKVGAKAIPVLGGFVNLWFARDRWRTGDKFGAGIEGLAGILDIASVIPGLQPLGVPALMLDGYMLVRDLVPQVYDTEQALLKKLSGSFNGIQQKADEMGNKLSGISKMFLDDKIKDEGDTGNVGNVGDTGASKELPSGTGTTPINISKVQKKNESVNGVSKNASYESGSTQIIEESSSETEFSSSDQSGQKETVLSSSGGSTSSSDIVDQDLFYKKAG